MANPAQLKIPAIEINQHGQNMYVFTVDSELLYSICTVSRRESIKEIGYQRNLSESRAKQIADYITNQKGIIPNNFIISFDKSVVFNQGTLSVPNKPDVAWVIDGQHRLDGLHRSGKKLLVSVLAFIGLNVNQQADLFLKNN